MKFNAAQSYMLVVSLVSLFRVSVYVFNLELVTKVKILKSEWENLSVREVAYGMTTLIRHLMTFKFSLSSWGVFFLETDPFETRNVLFCLCFFLSDIYIFIELFKRAYCFYVRRDSDSKQNSLKVLHHENPVVPLAIQSLITLSGAIYFFNVMLNVLIK